MIATKINNSY